MSSLPQNSAPFNQSGESTTDEFDLRDAIDTVVSRLWLVAIVFLIVMLAGIAYVLVTPSIYEADALIQVEEKKGSTLGGLQQIATALDVSQSPTAGEIEIIKSREVIGRAIETLHRDIIVEPEAEVPFFSDDFNKTNGGAWNSTRASATWNG